MREVFVAGTGMVRVGRIYGKGLAELAAEAGRKALESGIEPQAIVVANAGAEVLQGQANLASLVAESLGLRYRPALRIESGAASGGLAVYTGYSLVASGLYDAVLVVGVEKLTDFTAAASTRLSSMVLDSSFEQPYGITHAAFNAMMMRYYMERYGVTRDEMSAWPVLMHSNAAENPYAQLRREIKVEHVAKSQVVADPIRMLDASPVGDGAAAILLASREAVKHSNGVDPLVAVKGLAVASDSLEISTRTSLDALPAAKLAAEKALIMAGVEAKKLDVIEVHDTFTITGILLLEAIGLAEKGKAAKMLAQGRFHPGDKPAVNLSGGLKARGHPIGATGVYQAAEIAEQLMGKFPGKRVEGAEKGAFINMGDTGTPVVAMVFTRYT